LSKYSTYRIRAFTGRWEKRIKGIITMFALSIITKGIMLEALIVLMFFIAGIAIFIGQRIMASKDASSFDVYSIEEARRKGKKKVKEPKPQKVKKVKEPKPEKVKKVKEPKPEKFKEPKPEKVKKVKEPKPEKFKEPKPEKNKKLFKKDSDNLDSNTPVPTISKGVMTFGDPVSFEPVVPPKASSDLAEAPTVDAKLPVANFDIFPTGSFGEEVATPALRLSEQDPVKDLKAEEASPINSSGEILSTESGISLLTTGASPSVTDSATLAAPFAEVAPIEDFDIPIESSASDKTIYIQKIEEPEGDSWEVG
jgi:hypothetical protein